MNEIRDILTDTGISANKITVKTVSLNHKERVSDKILEELTNGGYDYDMVLLPKHDQTKAQEFLFGDTAVRLLRRAPVPVLSVKGTREELSRIP